MPLGPVGPLGGADPAMVRARKSVILAWVGLTVLSMLAAYLFFLQVLGYMYYDLVAGLAVSTLESLGVRSEAEGNMVAVAVGRSWTAVRIGWECSGVVSFTVYTGLVSGFPCVTLKKRLLGLALGYAAIFFGNFLRIVLILYLNSMFPNLSYILLHDFFGRPISFLWMTTIWFAWFYFVFIKAPGEMESIKDVSVQ